MCSVESLASGLVIRAFRLKGRGGAFCGLGPPNIKSFRGSSGGMRAVA